MSENDKVYRVWDTVSGHAVDGRLYNSDNPRAFTSLSNARRARTRHENDRRPWDKPTCEGTRYVVQESSVEWRDIT